MSILFDLLNRASGFALSLDPEGVQHLAPLAGKVILLDITAPVLAVTVTVTDDGLCFRSEAPAVPAEPDVSLRGSALDFARLGLGGLEDGSLGDGRITMQGDVNAGQAFQKALSRLDIDWEEGLARYVGDSPARKMGNVFRSLGDWSRETAGYSRQNIADYLSEERKLLVSDVALERFEKGVSDLRADTDRLEQRLNRLARMLEERTDKRS